MFITALENMRRGKERLNLVWENLGEYEKQRKRVEKTLKDISSYGAADSPLKLFANAMKKGTDKEKLKYTNQNLEEIKNHIEILDKEFKRLKRYYGKKT